MQTQTDLYTKDQSFYNWLVEQSKGYYYIMVDSKDKEIETWVRFNPDSMFRLYKEGKLDYEFSNSLNIDYEQSL